MIDNQVKLSIADPSFDSMDPDVFNKFAKKFLPYTLQVFFTSVYR